MEEWQPAGINGAAWMVRKCSRCLPRRICPRATLRFRHGLRRIPRRKPRSRRSSNRRRTRTTPRLEETGYRDPGAVVRRYQRALELSVEATRAGVGSQCPFPKLKLVFGKKETTRDESIFAGMEGLRIGLPLRRRMGRAADMSKTGGAPNEKSLLSRRRLSIAFWTPRGATLRALGRRGSRMWRHDWRRVAAGRAKRASSRGRNDDVKRRIGATGEIDHEQFMICARSVRACGYGPAGLCAGDDRHFQLVLRSLPEDTYRCDARGPLWNISVFKRADGPVCPIIADFDSCGHGRSAVTRLVDKVYLAGSFRRTQRSKSRL